MKTQVRQALKLLLVGSSFVVAFPFLSVAAEAQSDPPANVQLDNGIRPDQAYDGLHDNVSLSSGNVTFCIPLVSLPGINTRDLKIPLCYNSQITQVDPLTGASWDTIAPFPWGNGTPIGPGWILTGRPIAHSNMNGDGGYVVEFPDGSDYGVPLHDGSDSAGQGIFMTGSGYPDQQTIHLKDGTQVVPSGNSSLVRDTDYNSITFTPTSITDTIGRTVTVSVTSNGNGAPASIAFTYPTSIGNATVAVYFSTATYSCPQTSANPGANGTYSMPSYVQLPDGLTYTFQYDSCGHLTKVTYPSGGYTRYAYTEYQFGSQTFDGVNWILQTLIQDQVVARYVCPVPSVTLGATSAASGNTCPNNVAEETTTYTPQFHSDDTNNEQNTVIDPVGNKMVVAFSQVIPNGGWALPSTETSRQIFSGTSKLLRTITTTYNVASAAQNNYPLLPVSKTVTLDNGLVSETDWSYNFNDIWEGGDSPVIQQVDYDYGIGSHGPKLRTTQYDWLQLDYPGQYDSAASLLQGTACCWILDKRTRETVYDGNGNMVSDSKYIYNNGNNPGGEPFVTGVQRWNSSTNSYLQTSYQIGPGGVVTAVTDPNNNQTTYSYADNFTDGQNHNTGAFITQITYPATNGVSQVEQRQYYYGSGLIAASCGKNYSGACVTGKANATDYVSYQYDVMGRMVSATTGDGGSTVICYSDDIGSSCQNNSYPLTTVGTKSIAAGVTKAVTMTLDGLGRTQLAQLKSDPNCNTGTIVQTMYDLDERISTRSNPYCSTSDPTYGATTATYDGLGRVVQVSNPDGSSVTNTYVGRAVMASDEGNGGTNVTRISQYDALGRVTNVCEVSGTTQRGTSNNTPSNCGLDIAGTGFLTAYTYDALDNLRGVSQGNIGRSFAYDSMSRLVTANNPESGTTTYGYDANGNLTSRQSAKGITTTYAYDQMNRLLSKTYSDGSTPSACFQYDMGSSNGTGRLTAEWTQVGMCPSTAPASGALTQRTFAAFDAMGRIAMDEQCSTPGNCNGTPNSVSYTYDLAGDVASVSNGLAGSNAMTFTNIYDSADRLSTMTAPQSPGGAAFNLFYASNYTPAGAIQNAAIGTGISLHRDYNKRLLPTDEIDTVATTSPSGMVQVSGSELFDGYTQGTISFSGTEQCSGSTCDGGLFIVTVGTGQPIQVQYGQNSSPATLASGLASVITCANNGVQAMSNGGTVYLQSCASGTNTNYSINAYADGHSSSFSQYSFAVSTSGAKMTPILNTSTVAGTVVISFSGAEQNGQTGSYEFIINSSQNPNGPPVQMSSVNWSSSSTPATLATSLAASLGSCGAGQAVQGTAAGSSVYITPCQSGSNYNITSNLNGYSGGTSASFTVAAGSAQLADVVFSGTEQLNQGGAIGLFINTPYPTFVISWGSGSTPNSLAASLVSAMGSCSTNGNIMVGIASGATVFLAPCQPSATYSVSASVINCGCQIGNGPSFSVVANSASSSLPPVTDGAIYDSGTASLSINGVQVASTPYGSGSNAATIVNGLVASSSSNTFVTLQADGSTLTMIAKGQGSYSYALNVTSSYPSTFSPPSFGSPIPSGSLAGAQNVPLYNWTINTYAPDGDLLSVTDSVIGAWSYSFDDLDRLVAASASGGVMTGMNLSWDYDRYGNRWDQTLTGSGSAVQTSFSFSGNNNRIDQYSSNYDDDGNLTNDGQHSYAYDAENRLTSVSGQATYVYDAEGLRVAKLTPAGALSAVYVLGSGNQQLSEINGSGVWKHSNIYAPGGRLLATYEGPGEPSPGYHYNLTDWLGTKRMQTNSSGNQEEVCTSLPFGDSLNCSGIADATEAHFTGKDRDNESGLDYSPVRYLTSVMGRWMRPDTYGGSSSNPQTLNRYAYVGNNPVRFVDPLGYDDDDQSQQNSVSVTMCFPACGGVDVSVTDVNLPDLDPDVPDPGTLLGDSLGPAGMDSIGGDDVSFGPQFDAPVSDHSLDGSIAGQMGLFGPQGAPYWTGANSFVTNVAIGATLAYGGAFAAPAIGGVGTLAARGVGTYLATATGTGIAVIGRHPEYLDDAEELGANVFSMPDRLWKTMDWLGQSWTANQAFLDRVMATNQQIYLSTQPLGQEGSIYSQELFYLESQGRGPETWLMVPK